MGYSWWERLSGAHGRLRLANGRRMWRDDPKRRDAQDDAASSNDVSGRMRPGRRQGLEERQVLGPEDGCPSSCHPKLGEELTGANRVGLTKAARLPATSRMRSQRCATPPFPTPYPRSPGAGSVAEQPRWQGVALVWMAHIGMCRQRERAPAC